MYEQFKSLLVEELNIEPELITMDAELTRDLGINSLDLADLVLLCEDKFGIEIEDEKLSSFICIRDIIEYLQTLE